MKPSDAEGPYPPVEQEHIYRRTWLYELGNPELAEKLRYLVAQVFKFHEIFRPDDGSDEGSVVLGQIRAAAEDVLLLHEYLAWISTEGQRTSLTFPEARVCLLAKGWAETLGSLGLAMTQELPRPR